MKNIIQKYAQNDNNPDIHHIRDSHSHNHSLGCCQMVKIPNSILKVNEKVVVVDIHNLHNRSQNVASQIPNHIHDKYYDVEVYHNIFPFFENNLMQNLPKQTKQESSKSKMVKKAY